MPRRFPSATPESPAPRLRGDAPVRKPGVGSKCKDENTQCAIVIDCEKTKTVEADASQDDELAKTQKPEKLCIIYSCKNRQSSKDNDGYRLLSIFTKCFLENLRAGLSIGEVFNRTRDDVKKRALDSGNEQEPEIDGEPEIYF